MRLAFPPPVVLTVLALGFSGLPAAAQDDPHAACAAVGWVPRAVLERPVALRTGIGRTHEAVTTSSPEARAFHDQGLSYLHSYVWIEAARSFNQALRLDPKLALSWVGLSRAYSGLEDGPAARAGLQQARALSAGVSEKERRKIELRALQLDAVEDVLNPVKHAEYKRALDEALARDMEDVELWLLRGNAEEGTAAGRGQRGGAGSVAFYHQALAVSPDHFAAHHYLVHSYETLGQVDKALAHGEIYARLAPAIPHAHHMWGHDLRRVGRVDDAIAAFRKAYDLETAYYRSEGLGPELDWHRVHNLDLLATCYQHQGRMRATEQTMRERAGVRPVMAIMEFNRKAWPGFLLAAGRSGEALAAAGELAAGRWSLGRAVGHALAAQALLALDRVEPARKELDAARTELEQVPAMSGMIGYSRASVEPYVDAARGELLLRTGAREEARALLKDVESRIRAVPGPDAWMDALFRLEDIARLARDAGDWELAAYTAEQMKDHDSAYAGTRYALGLVAEQRGDAAAAAREFGAAVDLWKDADPDLAVLRDARARAGKAAVAALAATGGPSR